MAGFVAFLLAATPLAEAHPLPRGVTVLAGATAEIIHLERVAEPAQTGGVRRTVERNPAGTIIHFD